jgi:hypothetical protein
LATPSQPVTQANRTADVQLVTGKTYLTGFSVRENAGTPAVAAVVLHDGDADTDPGRIFVELDSNQSVNMNYDSPIAFKDGIFLEVESGEIDITVFVQ